MVAGGRRCEEGVEGGNVDGVDGETVLSLCVLTGEADFEAANTLAATARSRVTIGGAPYITRV